MPEVITLEDLAAMIEADTHGRRYETSPEGVLFVVPPPTVGHAVVASLLMGWLHAAGWPLQQVLQVVGVRIPGPEVDGGRIPDLTVWARPQPADTAWRPTSELVLAVEIVSRGSEGIDQVLKVAEYARAGIQRYWTVARDDAQTVTLYRLTAQGIYETTSQLPLASLLERSPAEFLEIKP